jgi:hypothetical protein
MTHKESLYGDDALRALLPGMNLEALFGDLFIDPQTQTKNSKEPDNTGTVWETEKRGFGPEERYNLRYEGIQLALDIEDDNSSLTWHSRIPKSLKPSLGDGVDPEDFFLTAFYTLPTAIYQTKGLKRELPEGATFRRYEFGSTVELFSSYSTELYTLSNSSQKGEFISAFHKPDNAITGLRLRANTFSLTDTITAFGLGIEYEGKDMNGDLQGVMSLTLPNRGREGCTWNQDTLLWILESSDGLPSVPAYDLNHLATELHRTITPLAVIVSD